MTTEEKRHLTSADLFAADCLPCGETPVWQDIAVSAKSFDVIKNTVLHSIPDLARAKQVLLACDEIIANIASYSGAGRVSFFCRPCDSSVFIGFRDDGIAFDPTMAAEKETCFEDMEFGGMGLNLVLQIKKSWHYRRISDENVLIIEF